MLIDKLRLHSFLRTYLYETDSWNKSGLEAPEQMTWPLRDPVRRYSTAVYTNSWNDYDALRPSEPPVPAGFTNSARFVDL